MFYTKVFTRKDYRTRTLTNTENVETQFSTPVRACPIMERRTAQNKKKYHKWNGLVTRYQGAIHCKADSRLMDPLYPKHYVGTRSLPEKQL